MVVQVCNTLWNVVFVNSNSDCLSRSDGSKSVGVTDWNDKTIYLDNNLCGAFLDKVICHELCHVYSMSYGLFIPIDVEEQIADFLATYGRDIFAMADMILMKLVA